MVHDSLSYLTTSEHHAQSGNLISGYSTSSEDTGRYPTLDAIVLSGLDTLTDPYRRDCFLLYLLSYR